MDLKQFCGSAHPWLNPFTVVDKYGSTWNIATDRSWLMAVKARSRYPRCEASSDRLVRLLDLVQIPSNKAYTLSLPDVQSWIGSDPTQDGAILEVPVDLLRLRKLLNALPWKQVKVSNGSNLLGNPGLIFEAKEIWRGVLMGVLPTMTPTVFDLGDQMDPLDLMALVDSTK